MADPVIITAPTVEPVTPSEFKTWSRINFDDEDTAVIEPVLQAARLLFEHETGRTCHQTVYDHYLDKWPRGSMPIVLPKSCPLISLGGIFYRDSAGTESEWDSAEYVKSYATSTLTRIRPAYGMGWKSFTPFPLDPIRIRYTAGIANGSPQTFLDQAERVAIMMIAASMFEIREAENISDLKAVTIEMLSWHARACVLKHKVSW